MEITQKTPVSRGRSTVGMLTTARGGSFSVNSSRPKRVPRVGRGCSSGEGASILCCVGHLLVGTSRKLHVLKSVNPQCKPAGGDAVAADASGTTAHFEVNTRLALD